MYPVQRFIMLSSKDKDHLNNLIKNWNAGDVNARNEVVTLLQPLIKHFSEVDFSSKNKVIPTPVVLFCPNDIAQTVSLKLVEKQKSIHIESVNDLFILLRKMVYGIIVDEVRKLTSSRHGLGSRTLADTCDDVLLAEDKCFEHSHTFIEFKILLDDLEEKSRDQALAFSFYHLWGFDIATIQTLLNDISERTVWRYIEFAHKYLSEQLKQ